MQRISSIPSVYSLRPEGQACHSNPLQKCLKSFRSLTTAPRRSRFSFEVLTEISQCQKEGYARGNDTFATREGLFTSRSIHMPFTPTREKNIDYLIELLIKRFPNNIAMFVSFDFNFDESSKKLSLIENEEYAINLSIVEIETIRLARDQLSLENFTRFIRKFRLFNLDKVVSRARNRQEIGRVIDTNLNKDYFTYRHYFVEKNRAEGAEDYCFHAENYEHVKRSLNLMQLQNYLANYNELVKTRLRKFGILNTDVGDYRDSKIDYILSIFMGDLETTLPERTGPK